MDSDGTCENSRFNIQKVGHPSGTTVQLAAETCEFSQVPSLSVGVQYSRSSAPASRIVVSIPVTFMSCLRVSL